MTCLPENIQNNLQPTLTLTPLQLFFPAPSHLRVVRFVNVFRACWIRIWLVCIPLKSAESKFPDTPTRFWLCWDPSTFLGPFRAFSRHQPVFFTLITTQPFCIIYPLLWPVLSARARDSDCLQPGEGLGRGSLPSLSPNFNASLFSRPPILLPNFTPAPFFTPQHIFPQILLALTLSPPPPDVTHLEPFYPDLPLTLFSRPLNLFSRPQPSLKTTNLFTFKPSNLSVQYTLYLCAQFTPPNPFGFDPPQPIWGIFQTPNLFGDFSDTKPEWSISSPCTF